MEKNHNRKGMRGGIDEERGAGIIQQKAGGRVHTAKSLERGRKGTPEGKKESFAADIMGFEKG